jgi:hypothetical protein
MGGEVEVKPPSNPTVGERAIQNTLNDGFARLERIIGAGAGSGDSGALFRSTGGLR